ncbi:MAG: hypothetical protein K2G99_02080 [Desulfovibrio sp.]|nr:hypothetical protein [Desulfovibrio sp.]
MRIFFISNYFPGELGPLARELAARPENEVLFASSRQRKGFALAGVRRVRLKNVPLFGDAPPTVPGLWEEAARRGASGLRSLESLRESWGAPDMVFASLAGGAALFVPQAFPGAFLTAYAETGLKNFPLLPEAARRAWILLQSSLFLQADLCFAHGEAQRRLFPRALREDIRLVPPSVDAEVFSRAAARPWRGEEGVAAPSGPGRLLTLDATGLAGPALALWLRVAHGVLGALPDCQVVMLLENARLREALLAAVAAWPKARRERLAAFNSLPFERYRDLLAASSLVVCPGRGAGAERAMLEAMSCETLLMAHAGAANFLRPGVNMLELPRAEAGAEPHGGAVEEIFGAVVAALEAQRRGADAAPTPQGRMARRNVLAHFSEATVVPRHLAEVMRACAAWQKERGA